MNELHPKLKEILDNKIDEIKKNKLSLPKEKIIAALSNKNIKKYNFKNAIKIKDKINFICECKKATPTTGILRDDYKPESIAKEYEQLGATAISVLTEEKYFLGKLDDLASIRRYVSLPILRKDFIIDEYQVYESKYFGADAILLIVKILEEEQLRKFSEQSGMINLDVVFEVSNEKELETAIKLHPKIIGINSRNLETFEINLTNIIKIKKLIPKNIITIAESGISTKDDIRILQEAGFDAVLIGSYFMRSKDLRKSFLDLTVT